METLTLELPTMYGDHHVVEVRRILMELPGVDEIYASSAFHTLEVTFDPEKLSAEQITARLEETGYLGELPVAVETGTGPDQSGDTQPFFRHTAVYATTRQVVSFAQNVNYTGRPLWPCPGVGVIKKVEEV